MKNLNKIYEQFEYEEKRLKVDRENIKLYIENLRSQKMTNNPLSNMNEQQIKIYQLIQDKIRTGYKSK